IRTIGPIEPDAPTRVGRCAPCCFRPISFLFRRQASCEPCARWEYPTQRFSRRAWVSIQKTAHTATASEPVIAGLSRRTKRSLDTWRTIAKKREASTYYGRPNDCGRGDAGFAWCLPARKCPTFSDSGEAMLLATA